MAIPVANPPPRYEPGSVPPPPAPEPESPRAPRSGRGCLMLVGIGGAIACIASIGLAFGCRAIVQLGERDLVGQITASYRAAAVQSNESTADEPDLAGLERLADRREISVFTLAILNNRWNAALANDGKIDVRELHHGMELVHDIVRTGGNVDIEQYRDAR